ncbi:PKD domain protein [Prevotella intermedia]|uniref:PKD domain protein n=1 Tax=Prevotella intermedia TaxID=28131 RepID=A0A2M8M338_PREIN|nr:PKD domain protein [Prevotella intermedia]
MPFRSIAILLFTVLLSSCLKETAVPIKSAFTIEASEDKTSPVTIRLKNESYGADEYEWTFEGRQPSSSTDKSLGKVVFTQAGEHKITLRVWNAVEEKTSQQTLRVDSAMTIDFDFTVAINDIAPGTVSIINKSKGGSQYEWAFEGGVPSISNQQHPDTIIFTEGGEHKIHLRVFNGTKYEERTKTLTLQPPMQADFSYAPLPVDQDWEAPLTLKTTNLTTGGLSYHWVCAEANVLSPTSETTIIRFEDAGTYKLQMIAGNGKEEKVVEKSIVIKPNSGIIKQNDLKFGINEAKNSVGCFYSAKEGGVVTSSKIVEKQCGAWVDFGFFALNSSFNYCYFFAPNQAKANYFPKIDNAQDATFINNPSSMGINITNAIFDNIKRSSDMNQFTKWSETNQTSFNKTSTPHFVLVRTTDGRRGIIRIKEFVKDGSQSYIVADVKLEKRAGE